METNWIWSYERNFILHLQRNKIVINWAGPCENMSSGKCEQRRPRSASVSAQSDHRLRCPLTETLLTMLCFDGELMVRLNIFYCLYIAMGSGHKFSQHYIRPFPYNIIHNINMATQNISTRHTPFQRERERERERERVSWTDQYCYCYICTA